MSPRVATVDTNARIGGLARLFAFSIPLALFILAAPHDARAQGAVSPPADGQTAFNNSCRTCHSMDAGDNRLGPSLHGIVGKKAGATEGYQFSSALKGAGFEWAKEKLAAFIESPEAVVPGNNMKPYAGLTDKATRDAIVAFLGEGK